MGIQRGSCKSSADIEMDGVSMDSSMNVNFTRRPVVDNVGRNIYA